MEWNEKGVLLRDQATNGAIATLAPGARPLRMAEFSPNGDYIVTVDFGGPARVWRSKTGVLMATLTPATENSTRFADAPYGPRGGFSARFGPRGDRVVTTFHGPDATVWDVPTGRAIARFAANQDAVMVDAVISPDGNKLATAIWNGGVEVWAMFADPAPHVASLKHLVPRCLTPDQRAALFLEPEPPRWCITGPGLEREVDASKWAGKWPYQGDSWRNWLRQKDNGASLPMPDP